MIVNGVLVILGIVFIDGLLRWFFFRVFSKEFGYIKLENL